MATSETMSKMTRNATGVTLATALVLATGCVETKDWDEEIILQLFKPAGTKVGRVTVTASQSQNPPLSLDLEETIFANCESNKILIVPRAAGPDYPPVHVSIVAQEGVLPLEREVPVPAQNPVKLVLGGGGDLEPAACAPSVVPPIDDAGAGDDSAVNLPVGYPCSSGPQCSGGLCLQQYPLGPAEYKAFPAGYCSKTCTKPYNLDAGVVDECEPDGLCYQFKNPFNDDILLQVCLRKCGTAGNDCGRPGYECKPGNVCLPE